MADPDKKTRVVTAHLPEDLVRKVEAYATRQDRSKAWVVRQALEAWIGQEEEWDRLTQEALDEVDAGLTVPHEKVVEWLESLGTDKPLPMPQARPGDRSG